MRNHNNSSSDFPRESPSSFAHNVFYLINMSVLAGCFSCFGPTSSLEGDVLSLLEEYSLTRCVVRARTTGYRLGESPYGFVDEVGLVKIYIKCPSFSI